MSLLETAEIFNRTSITLSRLTGFPRLCENREQVQQHSEAGMSNVSYAMSIHRVAMFRFLVHCWSLYSSLQMWKAGTLSTQVGCSEHLLKKKKSCGDFGSSTKTGVVGIQAVQSRQHKVATERNRMSGTLRVFSEFQKQEYFNVHI